jgi:hypothetical protein
MPQFLPARSGLQDPSPTPLLVAGEHGPGGHAVGLPHPRWVPQWRPAGATEPAKWLELGARSYSE